MERGAIAGMTLAVIDRTAAALGASVSVQVRWHGEELDRLLDAAHAGIQHAIATSLRVLGWDVRVEVSFNHFGDRGRVDVMAFHPLSRIVLVVEVKSGLGDLQETLGRIDVKARLARQIAAELGWGDVRAVVPALVIGDSRLARRTVARHAALFSRYSLRGRAARAWIRHPAEPMPHGLLWFANRPDSRSLTVTRVRRRSNRRGARPA